MSEVVTIGLDIAKSVFQVHGVGADGEVLVRRRLTRARMLPFFAKLPRCLVGIEACSNSHFWARELTALGHDVKLMPAQYVKPCMHLHSRWLRSIAFTSKTPLAVKAALQCKNRVGLRRRHISNFGS